MKLSPVGLWFFVLTLSAQQTPHSVSGVAGGVIGSLPATPSRIGDLEQRVASQPDDMMSRAELLRAYTGLFPSAREQYRADYLRNVQTIINQFPASSLAGSQLCFVGSTEGAFSNAGDHANLAALWNSQVNSHFDDSKVVLNAIRFLEIEDKQQAELLFQRVISSRPDDLEVTSRLGFFYAAGLVGADSMDGRVRANLPPDVRSQWREHSQAALNDSTSAHVLLGAAFALPNLAMRASGPSGTGAQAWIKYSESLKQRAAAVDPVLASSKTMPVEFGMFAQESGLASGEPSGPFPGTSRPAPPGSIRVGKNVVAANLLSSTPPAYPPLAVQARIQGTVSLQVQIGPDGTVKNIQLISGHPLLVPAAVQSVESWRYKPTLLNGNPVTVITVVDVPFVLP